MAGNGRFRRTTSMTGITVDFEVEAAGGPELGLQVGPMGGDPVLMDLGSDGLGAMVSPRYDNRRRRRNSCEENMAPQFLRSCGLCQRRLAPGRDIYMYRGDTAFCSLECREQQIKNDDRKNKCSTVVPNYSDASAANSDTSGGNTGTFAVA